MLLPLFYHADANRQQEAAKPEIVGVWDISPTTGGPYVESQLAMSSQDPTQLLATAINLRTGGSDLFVSSDAGRRWKQTSASSGSFPDIDPIVTFGPGSTALFGTLHNGFSIWRSATNGRSWFRQPATVPGGNWDRPWIVALPGTRPGLLAAGKLPIRVVGRTPRDVIGVSISDDTGRTWRSPRLILPDPSREFLHVVSDLRVGPAGDVFLLYQVFVEPSLTVEPDTGRLTRIVRERLEGELKLLRSTDGGRSFGSPTLVGPLRTFGHGAPARATNGLGGGVLAIDHTTGSSRGYMYATWTNEVDGYLQIMVTASRDGGRSWTIPVVANDGGKQTDHSNPAVAVDGRGVVAVIWNDRRSAPGGRCFQTRVALSTDRGGTFGPSVPLSAEHACPDHERFTNGGDSQGLVGRPEGGFLAAWIGGTRPTRLRLASFR
jgi:hypothetical protein